MCVCVWLHVPYLPCVEIPISTCLLPFHTSLLPSGTTPLDRLLPQCNSGRTRYLQPLVVQSHAQDQERNLQPRTCSGKESCFLFDKKNMSKFNFFVLGAILMILGWHKCQSSRGIQRRCDQDWEHDRHDHGSHRLHRWVGSRRRGRRILDRSK